MLRETNQNNSIQRIRDDYDLEASELQEQPTLISPFIRRFVQNTVAAKCSVAGENSWSGTNLSLADAILDFGNPEPSAHYNQCIGEADNRFRSQMYGEDTPVATILNSLTEVTSNAESPVISSFLNDPIITQTTHVGELSDSYQIFADDIFNTHLYFAGRTESEPLDSMLRLAPWAFPQWPSGMTVEDMTMGAFLEMINPQSFSFEGLAVSFGFDERGITGESSGNFYGGSAYASDAAQLSRHYSSAVDDYLIALSNGDRRPESEDRPIVSNNFDRARILLCGHRPSLEVSTTVQNINQTIFDEFHSTIDDGGAFTSTGLQIQSGYQDCVRRCDDPQLNFGPECVTQCLLAEDETDLTAMPDGFQGSGICENMNSAYRDACIRNLAAERERAAQICEMRFGLNPNAPDHLDFSVLHGIEDCQAFSAITAYNCRRYFQERGPGIHTSNQSSEEIARQCVARYCGAYDTGQDADELSITSAQEAAQQQEEEILQQLEKSDTERNEIVIPAIQRAADQHRDTFTVRFGRGRPGENTTNPSTAHLYGGAQDIVITRTDGLAMTPEDYEKFAASILEELPEGFQVLSEVRIVDTFPNGLNLESISPAEVRYSYTPLSGIETEQPMITIPARELGVREYFHSGKRNTGNGVLEFFTSGAATGNHIHVGRPSRSLPSF